MGKYAATVDIDIATTSLLVLKVNQLYRMSKLYDKVEFISYRKSLLMNGIKCVAIEESDSSISMYVVLDTTIIKTKPVWVLSKDVVLDQPLNI